MDTYSPDELYAAVAEELFLSRKKAKATGGRNNIRAKGDGPEQAVRELIGSLMGGQYRVTQGHVVRADGMKSGQIDIIIVRDVPAATMHKAEEGEIELVRVEWVAAVGEVKASWAKQSEVIRSYRRMVEDMETLQEGRLVENKLRFGIMRDDATIAEMSRPITGRQWANQCYAFLIALGQGECKVKQLEDDIRRNGGCVSKVVEIGFGASPSGLSFAAVRPRGQGFRRRLADRGFPIHRLCASGFGRKRGAPRGASALFRDTAARSVF